MEEGSIGKVQVELSSIFACNGLKEGEGETNESIATITVVTVGAA